MKAVAGRGAGTWLTVRGSSMTPFIRSNDRVFIQPVRQSKPAEGDVLAYCHRGSGALLVHRAVRVKDGACWLKGDNSRGPADGPVAGSDLIGIVTAVERDGRTMRFGLGSEKILIAWVSKWNVLPATVSLLRRIRRYIRNSHSTNH